METNKYRKGQEVSQSLLVNIPAVTENHRDCDVTKSLKYSKKSRLSTKRIIIEHYIWYNTPHSSEIKKLSIH